MDNSEEPGEETTTGDDASDKRPFKVVQTVVNNNGKSMKTVALRYYEDMPHVAYIAVTDFLNMLVPNKSIKVNKTDVSQYQLVTSKGDDGDKVKYPDFSAFYDLSVGEKIANWYANK